MSPCYSHCDYTHVSVFQSHTKEDESLLNEIQDRLEREGAALEKEALDVNTGHRLLKEKEKKLRQLENTIQNVGQP